MSDSKKPNWRLETVAVHGGYRPDPTTRAVAVPIYQTVAYAFDDTQHGADLFDLKVAGNIYTRIMNPTTDVLEQRVAALEGGIAALALASGQAAVTYAILTIAEAGDNIVSSSTLYGGTYNLFAHAAAVRHHHALRRSTRYRLVREADQRAHQGDLRRVRRQPAGQHHRHRRAGRAGAPPRPAADRRQHRALAVPAASDRARRGHRGAVATKYLGGHGTSLGGAIIDSGKFPGPSTRPASSA